MVILHKLLRLLFLLLSSCNYGCAMLIAGADVNSIISGKLLVSCIDVRREIGAPYMP